MRHRNYRVGIYFTEDELERLTSKVRQTRLSREAYIRHALNGVEIKQAPPADFLILIREVRRIGSNINQILSLANTKGFLDVPQLRKALEQNRAVEKMLWDTFTIG